MPDDDELSIEDALVFGLAVEIAKARTRGDAAVVVRDFRAVVREAVVDAHTRRQLCAVMHIAVIFWKRCRQRLQ